MTILGIDPGFARIGYGVIKKEISKLEVLDFGCITTSTGTALADRLLQIESDMRDLIKKTNPDQCAIEDLFFFKNTKTAMAVAASRGVLMLSAKKNGLSVFEYTPLQIKQAVTGYGRAEKNQIMIMVKNILGIKSAIKLDDTSDALAVALCHLHSSKSLMYA